MSYQFHIQTTVGAGTCLGKQNIRSWNAKVLENKRVSRKLNKFKDGVKDIKENFKPYTQHYIKSFILSSFNLKLIV